jgi:YVTN family beta-propeller protein
MAPPPGVPVSRARPSSTATERIAASGAGVSVIGVGHYPSDVAVDPATGTVYTTNNGDNDISVVDGSTCNVRIKTGCRRGLPGYPTQDVGRVPTALAVDQRTETVYVANYTQATRGTSVSVVSAVRCNARHARGCTHYPHLPPAIPLPFQPTDIAINQQTHTIYVTGDSFTGTSHALAVINGRACNASRTKGCDRVPRIAHVVHPVGAVAVNPKTNTVYLTSYFSRLVSVLDGRTCNATNTRGCNHTKATVTVGLHPWRMNVDARTNTIYVTNYGANTVSVINGGTCDATETGGCSRHPGLVHVGHGPQGLAIDHQHGLAFVTNAGGNSVSVFDTTSCHGSVTTGCGGPTASLRVGPMPTGIAISQSTATVYVTNNRTDTLAIFKAAMPPSVFS